MAKLRAHGTGVHRVQKDLELSHGTTCQQFCALMSDGVVLTKNIFVRTDGTRNAQGWKRGGRTSMLPDAWLGMKQVHGWSKV